MWIEWLALEFLLGLSDVYFDEAKQDSAQIVCHKDHESSSIPEAQQSKDHQVSSALGQVV